MASRTVDSSAQIKELIRSGEKARALSLLAAAVKTDPNNVEAWWLISFALDDRQKQIYAVKRVLALNPGNPSAEKRLAQLDPMAGINELRQAAVSSALKPAPAQPAGSGVLPTSALRRQMPASSAVIATPAARLWTAGLAALFLLTIGSAFALNAVRTTSAAEQQAQADQALLDQLAAPPSELPPIVVVLPSETPLGAAVTAAPQEELPAELTPTPTIAAPTAEPTASLPELDLFAQSLVNGQPDQRVGVFVENLFSFPIVQQPQNDEGWITSNMGEVTDFRFVRSRTGNDGIIAHNYLAGGEFFSLQVGDIAELVLGDGSVIEFEITAIEDYQALTPNSQTTDFLSLATGQQLSVGEVFSRVYGGNLTLTFQTCINRDNISTWGRTFVIGEEL